MKDLLSMSSASRIPLLALFGLLLLGLWPTHGETPVRIPFEPTVTYGEGYGEEAVAQQAQSRFALKLFAHLLQQQPQENLFFSPLSLRLALSMLYNGAAGETQAAMAEVLEAQELSLNELNWTNAQMARWLVERSQAEGPIQVQVANGLWVDQILTLRPPFLQALATYYQAVVNRVELGSRQTVQAINRWVAERTQGQIDRIVDRLSREDVMVLLNAVHFKGEWTQPFDPALTKPQPFTRADGRRVQVPLMAQSGRYGYRETEQLQVVRLPYGEGELALLILLPKPGVSLATLQQELSPETWQEWTGSLPTRPGSVRIPKFKLAYATDLVPALQQLGMGIAFSRRADFSQMTSEPTQVSRVLHKAAIEVDEKGSEAAAATGVIVSRTASDRQEPFQFVADRPFWFAIVASRSGDNPEAQTVLFMGSLVDPG
ncbi:serpin family protein [Synechococcus sp. H55.7]|uniref:serpin family protein n=1 Tax=unclassified Synechococcus TaxID=2626047 RepID=UPI0039C4A00E